MGVKSFQSRLTLWKLMDCSFTVHGILQTRILTGLPYHPPGDLPDPGIKPASLVSPELVSWFFTTSTTWEALITHTNSFFL